MIRSADLNDIERVYQIAKGNSLNDSPNDIDSGFLVSNYTLEKYREIIEREDSIFLVLEQNNEIVAFLLGYNLDTRNISMLESGCRKVLKKNKEYFLLKQICVDKNYKRKGFASALYNYLFKTCARNIVLSIVTKPLNEASVKFNESRGFEMVYRYTPKDEMERGFFLRRNNPELYKKYDSNIVLEQYNRAVELYIHEDNLNWSKINHLFYVNGVFVALLTFISNSKSPSDNLSIYYVITAFLGFISSTLFTVSISSGIIYLKKRKKSVRKIESILQSLNGLRVISDLNHKEKVLKNSPTTVVIRLIPIIITGLWFVGFIFALLKLL